MIESQNEMMKILDNSQYYSKSDYKTLSRTRYYKLNYKRNIIFFVLLSIKNIDLFIYNIYYRLRWRGALKR